MFLLITLFWKHNFFPNYIFVSDNINSILQSEEMYIEILLDTVAHMSPNLLGPNGVKKLKNGMSFAL